jgi:hypothetical protein
LNHLRITLLALIALIAIGCGSDTDAEVAADTKDAPAASEFPSMEGKTWSDLAEDVPEEPELVVAPAGSVYEVGENRFSFGVFEVDQTQIDDADVALYASRGADGLVEGPFPARIESLKTEPAFASQTTSQDPLAATVAYISDINFETPGEWRVVAMVKQGGETSLNLLPSVEVGPNPKIPDVGDMAPSIHTPTAEDVGDLSAIDTRQPHDTMHDVDFADVVGKKPTVLLFSTPALCASRVCGPMVDIQEEVKAETDADVAFIHQEVYVDNDPNKGPRPQLVEYGLQSEPWLFVVDASGRITTRIEGAFSVSDLRSAVDEVVEPASGN